ncbi:cytochrome-c peroxidase [Pontibacter sp. BT327]|uniref:Methylamine utilization protein MauG n=2 Tax=Pontibacter burrus TaxID=2704466 RepID=A0A6B3LZ10_9BACT|nr:cytochrome-c peroxidase [Pontibacter burrus]
MWAKLGTTIVGIAAIVAACERPASVAPAPELVQLQVPANFPAPLPQPAHNPATAQGILLGKKLFFDPALSVNGNVSCATCHQPQKAFSDGQALSSAGVSGKALKRHAPALMNLAWMDGLFWDGGAKNLESLSFAPLRHPDEMGQDIAKLVARLQQHPTYPSLFKAAFGTDSITAAALSRALAQYQRTLVSASSRYDKHIRNEPHKTLTQTELQGLHIFKKNCSSCHATDLFTDNRYHNNGLDNSFPEGDEDLYFGYGRISRRTEDIGKYKTPTLRNIALTAPYMHDGRFKTLEEVLQHYSSGVKWSASLAPELQQHAKPGIPLTATEQQKLIAFLHTLTDEAFVKTNYSSP